MPRSKSRRPRAARRRYHVGRVSYYHHHGSWWLDYRQDGQRVRKRVGPDRKSAQQHAAVVNAQLETAAPTLFSFQPVSVERLRQEFLDYHEFVQHSSLATVTRYAAATKYLEQFVRETRFSGHAHEIDTIQFAKFLRGRRVAANGHAHSPRRPLRDAGVRYILETCRSMFGFARRKRYLPPYADNPFAGLGGKRFSCENAKPIFVFDEQSELEFFRLADPWSFGVHFTLAKLGLRPGELIHQLIEDVDLTAGWLKVRSHPQLGWRIKTRRNRDIPIIAELGCVLRRVIGKRRHGPLFLRENARALDLPFFNCGRDELIEETDRRIAAAMANCAGALSRRQIQKVHHSVWRDAGAVRSERIRNSFARINQACGHPSRTCPKSWRHTFATLLQDANVDPLIRQITLGHSPTTGLEGALGMTTVYTHTRPTTQKHQIETALRSWPEILRVAQHWSMEGNHE